MSYLSFFSKITAVFFVAFLYSALVMVAGVYYGYLSDPEDTFGIFVFVASVYLLVALVALFIIKCFFSDAVIRKLAVRLCGIGLAIAFLFVIFWLYVEIYILGGSVGGSLDDTPIGWFVLLVLGGGVGAYVSYILLSKLVSTLGFAFEFYANQTDKGRNALFSEALYLGYSKSQTRAFITELSQPESSVLLVYTTFILYVVPAFALIMALMQVYE